MEHVDGIEDDGKRPRALHQEEQADQDQGRLVAGGTPEAPERGADKSGTILRRRRRRCRVAGRGRFGRKQLPPQLLKLWMDVVIISSEPLKGLKMK